MMNDRTSPINSCPLIPALPPSSNCYTHVEVRTRSVRGRGNMIQNKTDDKLVLIFIFYNELVRTLVDMIILKGQDKINTKIYIIDDNFK